MMKTVIKCSQESHGLNHFHGMKYLKDNAKKVNMKEKKSRKDVRNMIFV